MKTLIPLTDYILEQFKLLQSDKINKDLFIERVIRYTNLLKQPLELGYFVACDLEGNVLEEKNIDLSKDYEYQRFLEAKSRVLF